MTVFHSADFLLSLIPDDRPPNRIHFLASTSVVKNAVDGDRLPRLVWTRFSYDTNAEGSLISHSVVANV